MSSLPAVAIVHYHLRPGGVTRVIEHVCRERARRGAHTVVISGEPPPSPGLAADCNVQVVPGLVYDGCTPQACDTLGRNMERAARAALGRAPDLWHFHNHSLGKNAGLTALVHRWAGMGRPLLLQVHDFCEDGRPDAYRGLATALNADAPDALGARLYPNAPHTHFAVLNGRDQRVLADAGGTDERLHLLPDPVSLGGAGTESARCSDDRRALRARVVANVKVARLFVYPTRAIRRKNIGEFLLWACMAERDEHFAVTMAPRNPAAQPVYQAWVALAGELELPVAFEFGQSAGIAYPELLALADAAVTTSVAEGFGLAFLEPWLVGTPLLGRNLPEITADFVRAGVVLPNLYEDVTVPAAWVDRDRVAARVRSAYRASCAAYRREPCDDAAEEAVAAVVGAERAAFGRLDEHAQEAVLRRVRGDGGAREAVTPSALGEPAAATVVEANQARVRHAFGPEENGRLLEQVYAKVLTGDGTDSADRLAALGAIRGERVLDAFLNPRRFTLLRT